MPGARYVRDVIGPKCSALAIDAAIGELAERQHGVVARPQLLELGIGPAAIRHRIRARRLTPVHVGVYAVGHRRTDRLARWIAAVLATGADAVLSHRSAAALWDIRPSDRTTVDVSVARSRRRRAGIRAHRLAVPPDERTVHDAIPVTSPARTLLDLAAILDRAELERAVERAEGLQLTGARSLPELLERYPGRTGAPALRAVLGRSIAPGVTRSELEGRFRELVAHAKLLRPEVNAWLAVDGDWIQVDFLWRAQRLIVELDGRETHDTRAAFERDRARDRRLVRAGWRVIRITWQQLRDEPDAIVADLAALLAERP